MMLFDVFKRKPVPPRPKWKLAYEGQWCLRVWEADNYVGCGRYSLVECFKTKEEALAKLEEIKDSPYYYD